MKQSPPVKAQKSSKALASFDEKDLLNNNPPRSVLARFLYKSFKYLTFISVLSFIVLGGFSILGNTSEDVTQHRQIFNLYQNDKNSQQTSAQIEQLLKKQSSKYVSDNVINLYLNVEEADSQNIQNRFEDLIHFTEYYLSQQHKNEKILRLPLNLNDEKIKDIIPESTSMKLRSKLKLRVRRFLQKNKLLQEKQTKQLTLNRVKKLVDNGKFGQIVDLIGDNTLNCVWEWINDEPSVVILQVSNNYINENTFENSKKALNKWLRQVSEEVKVIILSRQPLNNIYDVEQEDHIKSLEHTVSLNSISAETFCNHFSESKKLTEEQCLILRSRFETISQVEQFTNEIQAQELSLKNNQQDNEGRKVLQKVCEKGHIKYYFYENQEDAYKIAGRNKKEKKTRLERQLQALLVKWSQLKKAIGLNKLKDVYLTVSGQKSDQELTLGQVNRLGLVYDFNLHELKWRTQEDRIEYEISVGKACKGGKLIQEQLDQEERQIKKQEQEDQTQTQTDDQQDETDEQSDEQEEYEQNYIKWDQEKDKDHSMDGEQEVQLVDDEEEEQETIEQTKDVKQNVEQNNEVQDSESNDEGTQKNDESQVQEDEQNKQTQNVSEDEQQETVDDEQEAAQQTQKQADQEQVSNEQTIKVETQNEDQESNDQVKSIEVEQNSVDQEGQDANTSDQNEEQIQDEEVNQEDESNQNTEQTQSKEETVNETETQSDNGQQVLQNPVLTEQVQQ